MTRQKVNKESLLYFILFFINSSANDGKTLLAMTDQKKK